MNLKQLGWNNFFEERFSPLRGHGLIPGRIVRETRHVYEVQSESGRHQAQVSGHFHYIAINKSDYPTIGDWVTMLESAGTYVIEKVLERKSSFSRRAAGRETEEQVIAANIDILFIVNGLDGGRNFNIRGIERYLTMARESGTEPFIVLNKVDLCKDRELVLKEISSISGDVPVYLVSALTGEGLDELKAGCGAMTTIALTGHSGVGKSALINALLGEAKIRTGALREDDLRGRHTTTHKELFFIPGDLMLIDTPGLRELNLWGDEDSIEKAFEDISELASQCKFRDCTHRTEPGCAVLEHLADGRLDRARYENYLELRNELLYLNSKIDIKKRLERKSRKKKLSKMIKDFYKEK